MEYRNNTENCARLGQDESSGGFFLADFAPDNPDESLASRAAIKLQMNQLRIRISRKSEDIAHVKARCAGETAMSRITGSNHFLDDLLSWKLSFCSETEIAIL